MKTKIKNKQKSTFKAVKLFGLFMIALLACNHTNAQNDALKKEHNIKGVISDSYGPLPGVNIILKGTQSGTTTNNSGQFIFPKSLKAGDVLIISYLGYKKQAIEINVNTKNIELVLTEEMTEMIGALNSNTPYTSVRKKTSQKK